MTGTLRQLYPEQQKAILNTVLDEAVDKGPTSLHIEQVAGRVGGVGRIAPQLLWQQGPIAGLCRGAVRSVCQ